MLKYNHQCDFVITRRFHSRSKYNHQCDFVITRRFHPWSKYKHQCECYHQEISSQVKVQPPMSKYQHKCDFVITRIFHPRSKYKHQCDFANTRRFHPRSKRKHLCECYHQKISSHVEVQATKRFHPRSKCKHQCECYHQEISSQVEVQATMSVLSPGYFTSGQGASTNVTLLSPEDFTPGQSASTNVTLLSPEYFIPGQSTSTNVTLLTPGDFTPGQSASTNVNFTDWMHGEPDLGYYGVECTKIVSRASYGTWIFENCHRLEKFICELTPGCTNISCDPGYIKSDISRTCVKLFDEKKNWTDARTVCQMEQGDLVKIVDSNMNRFIHDVVNAKSEPGIWYWIGLSDPWHEGVYRWLDEDRERKYMPWSAGEPSNYENGEYCASINHLSFHSDKYTWNDARCSLQCNFVCEKRAEIKTNSYDKRCSKKCSEHCAGEDNPCNRVSGSCDHGCDPGFQSPLCERELPNSRKGKGPAHTSCGNNGGVIAAVAVCTLLGFVVAVVVFVWR
ncbi:C-type lectin [Elysia marginata]|uniref:C-type lectin n=1 Tax=Elysia marginata TaxID=1093978 RepID=A0AAV4I8V0_9GAST|nr:C-type lectin [Elysia marginata]